ncbi:MAG: cupin domain-containing protein [Spirochaetales bacterium]|nr:cupin domain-containing protein [Spirochaetales bacterium]
MAGINGIEIKQLSENEKKKMGIDSWSIWEKEISEFDWSYSMEERCYILEGKAVIKTTAGEVEIKKGDFVIFPKGLECTWKITEPIKKHYNFY